MTIPALPEGTAEATIKRLFPKESPYVNDPVGWIADSLDEFLWSKQIEICESVRDERYTTVQSCHGTGKSYIASRIMAWWIEAHPIGDAFIVSTAPTQGQVEAILWREVGRAHRKGDLSGRITGGMVPQWKFGQEIVGYGRKPQDLTSKEEAMAAFQGIHARYVLVVIDEAGGVPKWLFDAVDTLATNDNARVLAIGNPDDPASQFNTICSPGSGWNQIAISAFDTPNFTGEKIPDRLREDLISPGWVEERKKRWGVSSPLYASKVLGQFPKTSTDTLISPAALNGARDRTVRPEGDGVYAYDIARYGSDETVGYRNRKGHVRLCYQASKQSTMKTAGAIKLEVGRHQGNAPAWIDVIGVGGGVYDRCVEWGLNVAPFSASDAAFNPLRYGNRRAEVYWEFKEDVERGLFDLPPKGEDDDLYAQLGAIKWFIRNGKIWIESKEDMKKRGLPSPDRADAVVMACARSATLPGPPGAEPGRKKRPESAGIMEERW